MPSLRCAALSAAAACLLLAGPAAATPMRATLTIQVDWAEPDQADINFGAVVGDVGQMAWEWDSADLDPSGMTPSFSYASSLPNTQDHFVGCCGDALLSSRPQSIRWDNENGRGAFTELFVGGSWDWSSEPRAFVGGRVLEVAVEAIPEPRSSLLFAVGFLLVVFGRGPTRATSR